MSTFQIIVEELPQRCEDCGIIAETRPYGLNHEELCFDCAMKDEALTKIRAKQLLFGDISNEGY
jgi:hypothetical protein